MLRIVLFVAVVLSSSLVEAQEWAKKMFDGQAHDFGNVARGATVEYQFELSNLYQEDVHISGVRSSCGCTTPKILNDTLKTYEKGAILATFNTRSFLGQRSATLTVTIDKPFFAEVQLRVKGYIRSDIVLTPGGVELGSVDYGSPVEKTVEIAYAGRGNWKILDVKPASDYLEASVEETARSSSRVAYRLTVRLKDDAPAGYIKEQLILVTNDVRAKEFPVDIEGRVVSELTVSPASLFLGALAPGQKATKQLVVQGKKPFKIVAMGCEEPGFEFKTSDTSRPVHLVPVTFVAGTSPGKKTYRITIETDSGATQELTAYCQVVAPKDQVAEK